MIPLEITSTLSLLALVCFWIGVRWGEADRKRLQRRCRTLANTQTEIRLKLGLAGIEVEPVPAVPPKVIPGKPATVKIVKRGR